MCAELTLWGHLALVMCIPLSRPVRQGYQPPSFTHVETEAWKSYVTHPRYHGQEVRDPELRCGEDARR